MTRPVHRRAAPRSPSAPARDRAMLMEQMPLLLASPLAADLLAPSRRRPLSAAFGSRRPYSAAATSSALSLRPRSHSSVRAFSPPSSPSPPYIAPRIMNGHRITSNPVTPTSPTPRPSPRIPSEKPTQRFSASVSSREDEDWCADSAF
ncbi:hypothetical protein Syun_014240 [Stephania yunnanensis]|uniref:Uncharacterized protein n=1 Tax=Stephania yunnanensis TaxID=152371 RepID=A0AAP0JL33_9MAGN